MYRYRKRQKETAMYKIEVVSKLILAVSSFISAIAILITALKK